MDLDPQVDHMFLGDFRSTSGSYEFIVDKKADNGGCKANPDHSSPNFFLFFSSIHSCQEKHKGKKMKREIFMASKNLKQTRLFLSIPVSPLNFQMHGWKISRCYEWHVNTIWTQQYCAECSSQRLWVACSKS